MDDDRHTIRSIIITDLFGQYTYELPQKGSFSDAAILYGDNGAGKSTILKLVFHLLSAANNRGHRTALTEIPYRNLEVTLNSGIVLGARRADNSISGSEIHLSISDDDQILSEWHYNSDRSASSSESTQFQLALNRHLKGLETKSTGKNLAESVDDANKTYVALLAKISPSMFYLSADRRLESDSLKESTEEAEGRFFLHLNETRRVDDVIARSREAALTNALNKSAAWIRQKAFHSANLGSTNVHTVYTNVVRHLTNASATNELGPKTLDGNALRQRLSEIALTTDNLAKYELAIPVDL